MSAERISIVLADDNLLVRTGVKALLEAEPDFEIVGVAEDYGSLMDSAIALAPRVIVTDIRMPPGFGSEGIDAAKEVRKRNPGTGVVILSQYDDPEYAISLLKDGQDGYAYLLKDRVAEENELAKAIRAVAAGSCVLDPKIVESIVEPVCGELSRHDEELLRWVAEGRPIKRIASARGITAEAAAHDVEQVLLAIARGATAGTSSALRHLHALHEALVVRDEVEATMEKLLPSGLVEKLRAEGRKIGETERLTVTVLITDVRGYSSIAERTDPARLAAQLNQHRALLNDVIHTQGGTVMQFTGDGAMSVFGAPFPQEDHADRALRAAIQIHEGQVELNERWLLDEREPFSLGIGLSTGEVAAALLGSDERLEYSLVGDTVNLASRLQDLARPGGSIILSEATLRALASPVEGESLGRVLVKGREAPVVAHRVQVVSVSKP